MAILAVTRLGIVTPDQLAQNRRYAILVIAIVAAAAAEHRPRDDDAGDHSHRPALRVEYLARSGHRHTQGKLGLRAQRPGALGRVHLMLFDIGSGRKKRVVQVIYAMLALLFLVGFVGFGIGGEIGSGGIADIFTDDSGELRASPVQRGRG